LSHIGEYADSRGVVYCIRPSLDSGARLAGVLDAVHCPALRVCLDPAAMVMQGVNPLASVEQWIEHTVMLHARDGTAGLDEHAGHETLLGQGDVDLIGVLAVLDTADVPGPYILRRTDATSPIADLADARDTLEKLLPPG
jgi:sugar phosphate isomerase/epimerase